VVGAYIELIGRTVLQRGDPISTLGCEDQSELQKAKCHVDAFDECSKLEKLPTIISREALVEETYRDSHSLVGETHVTKELREGGATARHFNQESVSDVDRLVDFAGEKLSEATGVSSCGYD
jgi:hypothetical protein